MSNLTTNESTDDETEYFKFEDEFSSALECFSIPYTKANNVIRWTISFDPPSDESEHIINDENGKKIVTTTGGVCIAKVSFKVLSDDFDMSGFALQEDTSSPKTGIKINLNITNAYENQSTFRFTDATASKNANLSNLIVSSGQVDELDPSKSTYKEYEITPSFDKDTLSYQMELLEYLDEIDIKPVLDDAKSTIKIKVPKRFEDGNLEYDTDGVTIIYEEKEVENDVAVSVTLNKLGEPDTHITLIVTAEDNKTTKSYDLIIKRPYGTIKGSIYTAPTAQSGIYKSDIRLYKSDDVSEIIDWATVSVNGMDNVHSNLMTLESQDFVTNDDGTYEINVIPGTYDILLDKAGYLDHIYKTRAVNAGDVIDLGYKELYAGDVNKDGNIQLQDLSLILNVFGKNNTDSQYDIKFDFNEDGQIQLQDYSLALNNFTKARLIE